MQAAPPGSACGACCVSGTARDTILDTYKLADEITAIRADLQKPEFDGRPHCQHGSWPRTASQAEKTIRQNLLSAWAIALALGFLFGVLNRH